MLPREMPRVDGLEIAAATQTAAEVGGDYYDVRASDGEALFAFGDASGHGVSARIMVTAAKGQAGRGHTFLFPFSSETSEGKRLRRGGRFPPHPRAVEWCSRTAKT